MIKKCIIISLSLLFFCGCAARNFRFADKPPIWRLNDQVPIPMPKGTKYIRMDYYYKVLVRQPAVKVFNYAPIGRSKDVNSYDHIPASSWYTPRLGYREVTPEELLQASNVVGPPDPPVRVVRAKESGTNPCFIIADSKDRLYLIKFDPPDYPAIETTTALICNRLFWGFGYNVPEDYIFYFQSDEVPIDSTANITEEQVKLVFSSIAPPVDGVYRSTASLYLQGNLLGPINDTGTRKGDSNDTFSHEDRRILRALKVFGAFTNQTDIRIDNSMDVYVSDPGELGYVKHYLLDFGEAMGAHGAKRKRISDGFTHIFSFGEMFSNIPTLGLRTANWEYIKPTPWKSVGAFEAEYFDPEGWKETYPFAPIRRSQADDNYWAAKIVAAVNREHLEKLVEAANYPEAEAGAYVVETLLQRRQKIIDAYFKNVSPIEYVSVNDEALILEDYGRRFMSNFPENSRYQIKFFNDGKKSVGKELMLENNGSNIVAPLTPEMFAKANNYIRVEVLTWRGNMPAPRSAEFHLRAGGGKPVRLVGIVH